MPQPDLGVVISGFGGLDNPEPGTPVARALRLGWRGGLHITALGYDRWITGAWSPGLVDRLALVPPLANGDEAVFARLMKLHRERPFAALLPCLDLEIRVYARLAQRLRAAGIRTLLPPAPAIEAVTKPSLPLFCHTNGIATPRTVYVANPWDVPFFASGFSYPLMVKGTVAGARRVDGPDAAVQAAVGLNARWGGGVLLQEWIDGEEFVVAMLARENGSPLGMVPMRKLAVNQRGKGVVGAVIDDRDLAREALTILRRLNWAGPLELEFVRERRTRRLYLIEINNRFPNWILLSHWAGCNLPALLLREILEPGRSRRRSARPGTAFVRDVEEIVVPGAAVETLARRGVSKGLARPRARATRHRADGIRVAVTGLNSFDQVMPGMGVAAALRQSPEVTAVYGLGYGPYDACLYRDDLFDGGYRVPPDVEGDALVEWLAGLRRRTEVDAVLPCLDFEVPAYAAVAGKLAAAGVATLLPAAEALAAVSKLALGSARLRHDWGAFYIPAAHRAGKADALRRAVAELGFPLALKGRGSETAVASTPAEAAAIWQGMVARGERDVLVQTFIHGDEFSVAGVCDRDHRLVAATTIKKLLVCDRGKTWGARAVELPALVAAVGDFLAARRWCGPFELEFIRDRFTERFALLECNPRFPAWIGFSTAFAANLPRLAVLAALGRPLPSSRPADDGIFTRNCQERPVAPLAIASFANTGVVRHARA
ncbi:MAG: ATP-grasp domain-containing protein [Proteobacteria bacterium]|nr:ATP-grasp domain-containing protein [Pseudomonadota bacterium]